MKKLIFLDRDGVINKNIRDGYVIQISQLEWLPFVFEGLRRLNQPENYIYIVTNQAAVQKGFLDDQDLGKIHSFLLEAVQREKGRIDEIYYCPHTPEALCSCRKPKSGLLLRGMQQFMDFEQLWMIGDSLDDIRAAEKLAVQPFLLNPPGPLLSSVKIRR